MAFVVARPSVLCSFVRSFVRSFRDERSEYCDNCVLFPTRYLSFGFVFRVSTVSSLASPRLVAAAGRCVSGQNCLVDFVCRVLVITADRRAWVHAQGRLNTRDHRSRSPHPLITPLFGSVVRCGKVAFVDILRRLFAGRLDSVGRTECLWGTGERASQVKCRRRSGSRRDRCVLNSLCQNCTHSPTNTDGEEGWVDLEEPCAR